MASNICSEVPKEHQSTYDFINLSIICVIGVTNVFTKVIILSQNQQKCVWLVNLNLQLRCGIHLFRSTSSQTRVETTPLNVPHCFVHVIGNFLCGCWAYKWDIIYSNLHPRALECIYFLD